MTWLLLSILCSTVIFILFKLFGRYGVDDLQAIVINYFAAYAVGTFSGEEWVPLWETGHYPWFWSIVILGFVFIALFRIMALVSRKMGVSVASVTVKMSLVIPVLFAVVHYHENLNTIKIAGIITALVAVFLATRKKETATLHTGRAGLLFILFAGSGFLDAFLKYNQQEWVIPSQQGLFTASIFGIAGLMGIPMILFKALSGPVRWQWKNLCGGIVLGIVNYGSIYYLIKALENNPSQSSVIFPVNNVGIVALSALAGALLFKEGLSRNNMAGILLAVIAIVLIGMSAFFNF